MKSCTLKPASPKRGSNANTSRSPTGTPSICPPQLIVVSDYLVDEVVKHDIVGHDIVFPPIQIVALQSAPHYLVALLGEHHERSPPPVRRVFGVIAEVYAVERTGEEVAGDVAGAEHGAVDPRAAIERQQIEADDVAEVGEGHLALADLAQDELGQVDVVAHVVLAYHYHRMAAGMLAHAVDARPDKAGGIVLALPPHDEDALIGHAGVRLAKDLGEIHAAVVARLLAQVGGHIALVPAVDGPRELGVAIVAQAPHRLGEEQPRTDVAHIRYCFFYVHGYVFFVLNTNLFYTNTGCYFRFEHGYFFI